MYQSKYAISPKKHPAGLNYQDILFEKFTVFLAQSGASKKTITNYRTDLNHFMVWTIQFISVYKNPYIITEQDIVRLFSSDHIEKYKTFMLGKHTPRNTINRRLSALRSFVSCLQHYNYLDKNHVFTISNVAGTHTEIDTDEVANILTQWEKKLSQKGIPPTTIQVYVNDVRQFLSWLRHSS